MECPYGIVINTLNIEAQSRKTIAYNITVMGECKADIEKFQIFAVVVQALSTDHPHYGFQ